MGFNTIGIKVHIGGKSSYQQVNLLVKARV
jgi:hypothetical protein